MKNLFILFATIFITISCKAQTPILPLYHGGLGEVQNAYYKDLDNDLDKFVGTWKYQNGNISLLIVIEKRTMKYDNFYNVYLDFLAGEVGYVENGVQKLNTLSNLLNQNLGLFDNTISGWLIKRPCSTCPANEREVLLDFTEQDRDYLRRDFNVRHYTFNGQEYLKVNLCSGGPSMIPPNAPANTPLDSTVPLGVYVLVKQ